MQKDKMIDCPFWLGDKVLCRSFIQPSGFSFEIEDGDKCVLINSKTGYIAPEEVDEYAECARFERVEKVFTGVFVGVTTKNTKLTAEYHDDEYCAPSFHCYTEAPKQFAVVYYANNKKRYVPLNDIEKVSG